MPWNSSKSDINTKHPVFVALHDWLLEVVKGYATLSRIWVGDWQDKVFQYTSGQITEIKVLDFPTAKKSYLPPPPKSRPRYGDRLAQENKAIVANKPWTKGLYEGVIAADVIAKQNLDQKNRIVLIVLDSTLEIAFKEYLVNDSGAFYSNKAISDLFGQRHKVHAEIQKTVSLTSTTWKKIAYYHELRNKLIHQKATATVPDSEISDFRAVVESVLKKIYKLKF